MTDIRKLPAQAELVETGPVKFGDDWPGVFVRGDNAAYYAMLLGQAIEALGTNGSFFLRIELEGLRQYLAGAVVGPAREMFKPPNFPCPLPQPAGPAPHRWLDDVMGVKPSCKECGLVLDGVLGYVCPHPRCPTGLGGPSCAVTCQTQDPIIGN